MNLDSNKVDKFKVDVWSHTDSGGIELTVTETDKSSGIFEGTVLNFEPFVPTANLGIDIGRSGMNTPIQENYFRFTLGFTFNDDEWFVKRKYN